MKSRSKLNGTTSQKDVEGLMCFKGYEMGEQSLEVENEQNKEKLVFIQANIWPLELDVPTQGAAPFGIVIGLVLAPFMSPGSDCNCVPVGTIHEHHSL